jgi:hypothetical protein
VMQPIALGVPFMCVGSDWFSFSCLCLVSLPFPR